jgi:radical SAM superfamily enzyme YgiQ (UPF0313 family)
MSVQRLRILEAPPKTLSIARATQPLRVALVRSPTLTSVTALGQDAVPPIGLAYVAGALEWAGHHVSVVDAVGEALHQFTRVAWSPRALVHGLRTEEIVERIDAQADVIGISCMFSVEWLLTRTLVHAIRRAFPDALIVLGGEHVTACPEYTLTDCPAADACVLGEGEETILDLLDSANKKEDLAQVRGLAIRSGSSIVQTAPRPRVRTIDEIPEPSWERFPVESYIDNAFSFGADLGRSMPILGSRGCPYQCTFCSSPQMWTTFWAARKPEVLIQEMKKYMARYRVTNFDFYDLTAIVRKDWIVAFAKMVIDERLDITWQLPSGTRSEAIDEEVVGLLYQSGCRIINYAPESGSPAELRRIKKRVTPDRMLSSMRAAYRAGLLMKTNFIFGLPGSSWADVRATFVFLARMALAGVQDVGAFPFSPYPGSELFDQLLSSGRIKLDEAYFRSLLAYTDPQHSVSYSDFIGSRMLSVLNLSATAFFYLCSFAFRPWRMVELSIALLRKSGSTKLTAALVTRRRKVRAMKLSRDLSLDTVVVPRAEV